MRSKSGSKNGRYIHEVIGTKYGRLTIIEEAGFKPIPCGVMKRRVLCKCECGNKKVFIFGSLRIGQTRSCGCLRKDSPNGLKHGLSRTRASKSWHAMIRRCTNKKDIAYDNWGGRGIKVCDRWLNSFESFYEDMGERPKGMTLGRVDNDGNYEPKNCRYEDWGQQQNNRRSNHILEFNGKKQTMQEWAYEININYSTLSTRIDRGWSVEKALSTPTRKHGC